MNNDEAKGGLSAFQTRLMERRLWSCDGNKPLGQQWRIIVGQATRNVQGDERWERDLGYVRDLEQRPPPEIPNDHTP